MLCRGWQVAPFLAERHGRPLAVQGDDNRGSDHATHERSCLGPLVQPADMHGRHVSTLWEACLSAHVNACLRSSWYTVTRYCLHVRGSQSEVGCRTIFRSAGLVRK